MVYIGQNAFPLTVAIGVQNQSLTIHHSHSLYSVTISDMRMTSGLHMSIYTYINMNMYVTSVHMYTHIKSVIIYDHLHSNIKLDLVLKSNWVALKYVTI